MRTTGRSLCIRCRRFKGFHVANIQEDIPAMSARIERNNAGLSLIELMWVAGIMSVGLVLLMSAVISVSAQNKASEAASMASHFNNSVLEAINGRDLETILTFNQDGAVFEVSEAGTIMIPGIGPARFTLFCIVPPNTQGEAPGRVPIPFSDSQLTMAPSLPNPVEIQALLEFDKGLGTGKEYKFFSSSLLWKSVV